MCTSFAAATEPMSSQSHRLDAEAERPSLTGGVLVGPALVNEIVGEEGWGYPGGRGRCCSRHNVRICALGDWACST
jgi:hypothetical protein